MTVGLYFGSFNPVHIGHLAIANHIAQSSAVQQVWLVVSPHNPLKKESSLLNEYHRLHLIQSAIEGETRLKASTIEFSLPRPSYTVDTLTYLKEKHPSYKFAIIMGSDSIQNIHRWKNYEKLLQDYKVIVYKRPGFDVPIFDGATIEILDAPMFDISSTRIREMVKRGLSIRYLVPDVVKDEIERNSYYK
jgi:nicotinate-nucleotide adenylyltransferase